MSAGFAIQSPCFFFFFGCIFPLDWLSSKYLIITATQSDNRWIFRALICLDIFLATAMRLEINEDKAAVGKWVAQYVATKIKDFGPTPERPFVLGLPTGSSPMPTYKELIVLHQQGQVSFKNVVTFNMDEYVALPREHPESYHSFMWTNFFSHVDIDPKNVNILDGK